MVLAGNQGTTCRVEEPTPPTRSGRKRKVIPAEPDLVGIVPKVVTMTDLEGGVSEEPLPKAELPEGWVPPKMVTQVWFCFILVML